MTGTLGVAVGQCPANLDGAQARLDWLENSLSRHQGEALDLVVLPELFQCGYNIGDLVSLRAETAQGAFAQAVAHLARRFETAILYGFSERQGKRLYNAAQCIDQTGTVIGQHRKLVLPPGFEGDHFWPGEGCTLFRLGDFTLAILICYDVEFPETLRHVALSGADLVLVPTALGAQWGVVAEKVVPTRAFENGVFLCYANYCGQEKGLEYFGGSCVIGPNGAELTRAGQAEALMYAKLARCDVDAARARLPYLKDRQRFPWA